MKTIWLTRHGETEWNTIRKMQGQLNSALTDNGIQQAKNLSKWIENERIDIIYTSPLKRAYDTATILKGHRDIPIVAHEDLMEINLGQWQGQCISDVKAQEPEKHQAFWFTPDKYQATSGEDFYDVRKRVQRFCQEVLDTENNKNILIVAHAIVLKSFIAYTKNLPVSKLWTGERLKPTSISKSTYMERKFSYAYIGKTEHYDQESGQGGWFIDQ